MRADTGVNARAQDYKICWRLVRAGHRSMAREDTTAGERILVDMNQWGRRAARTLLSVLLHESAQSSPSGGGEDCKRAGMREAGASRARRNSLRSRRNSLRQGDQQPDAKHILADAPRPKPILRPDPCGAEKKSCSSASRQTVKPHVRFERAAWDGCSLVRDSASLRAPRVSRSTDRAKLRLASQERDRINRGLVVDRNGDVLPVKSKNVRNGYGETYKMVLKIQSDCGMLKP